MKPFKSFDTPERADLEDFAFRADVFTTFPLSGYLAGKKRGMFAFRIHSRLNKVRADRERLEILAVVGDGAKVKIATFRR